MDAKTLAEVCTTEGHHVTLGLRHIFFDKAYGGPHFNKRIWMHRLNEALVAAHCTTSERVAMFLAQIGEESGSFRYTEELASGAEYEGRTDLGNTHPGDGVRFKGRTYIQITGRGNYTALSKWAYAHGSVPTSNYFVVNPEKLADVQYIFLGPVWYWTVARHMNPYADARDILGATRAVNGGTNGLEDRTVRWQRALAFGDRLLPTGGKHHHHPDPVPPTPIHHHPSPLPRFVTVRDNDTLSSIASANHTTWRALQKLNNLDNPNLIYVGQKLRVR